MTIRLMISDTIKGLLIAIVLIAIVLPIIISIIQLGGPHFYLCT
jgi:hypothetical protein